MWHLWWRMGGLGAIVENSQLELSECSSLEWMICNSMVLGGVLAVCAVDRTWLLQGIRFLHCLVGRNS